MKTTFKLKFQFAFFAFILNFALFSQSLPCTDSLTTDGEFEGFEREYTKVCDDPDLIKYIRVAYHFILKDNGTGNFTEDHDGKGYTAYNGFVRANEIISDANYELANNVEMWLPKNVSKTTPSLKFRYVLTGVYFHRSTAMYQSYQSSFAVHNVYGVDKDHTLNVYDMPIPGANGIAYWQGALQGNYACKVDNYPIYLEFDDWYTFPGNLLNHEIGHVLSLGHGWKSDDCADTPEYPDNGNCWGFGEANTDPGSACDTWDIISNNIMDYNPWSPAAYSPCQANRINYYLMNLSGNFIIHSCDECDPGNAWAYIKPEQCVSNTIINTKAINLNTQGSFNVDKYILEVCEVSSTSDFDCDGSYWNSGWINSAPPGVINLTSVYSYDFDPSKYYYVKFRAENSECPGVTARDLIFHTTACSNDPILLPPVLSPNPGNGNRTLTFENTVTSNISIYITNFYTASSTTLVNNVSYGADSHELVIDDSGLSTGIHPILVVSGTEVVATYLIKN